MIGKIDLNIYSKHSLSANYYTALSDLLMADSLMHLNERSMSHICQMSPKSLQLKVISTKHGILRKVVDFLHLKIIRSVKGMYW